MNDLDQRPLRVALFSEIFLPKIDGIVRVTCRLMENLRRNDAEVILFAPGEHPESYAGYRVVSIRGLPAMIYPGITVAVPGYDMYEILRDFKPDIVHVSHPAITGILGMYFAKRLGIPVIASFQAHVMQLSRYYHLGFLEPFFWWLHRFIFTKADAIVAPSRQVADELEAHGFGEVGLWRRGVDTETFNPAFRDPALREQMTGGHPERVLLISVGRLAKEKQIEQIKHALDAIPNTHLAIVGDGPYREDLEEIFAGCNVTFTGYKTGDDLSAAYASGDIFVFPSSPIETFGLVATEAMASGVPAVVSRVGGMPEVIQQGINGYMYEPDNTDEMVAHIRQLAEDTEHRQLVGMAARRAALKWSWDEVMDEFYGTYRHVIKEYHAKKNVSSS